MGMSVDHYSSICPVLCYPNRIAVDPEYYESIRACALAKNLEVRTIKELILSGGSKNGIDAFDLPLDCGFDVLRISIAGKHKILLVRDSEDKT
jgi:hypothetical protein